jgi:hypothetical protein
MNTQQFTKIARKAAKKIHKSGLFYELTIDTANKQIRYKDTHGNLYTWQTEDRDPIGGHFTIGIVHEWTESRPTYESGYNTIGNVNLAAYKIKYIQHTDNPDFILRASLSYLLN